MIYLAVCFIFAFACNFIIPSFSTGEAGLKKTNSFEHGIRKSSTESDWDQLKFGFSSMFRATGENMKRMFKGLGDFFKSHNEKMKKRLTSFKIGFNEFWHVDLPKLIKMRNRKKKPVKNHQEHGHLYVAENEIEEVPQIVIQRSVIINRVRRGVNFEFSYINDGCVSPVENQGLCATCWAYAASTAVEGQICKKTGKIIRLSEQQLIDCSSTPEYGNNGCEGGDAEMAWQYWSKNGIDSENLYPKSQGSNNKTTCKDTKKYDVSFRIRKATTVRKNYGYFKPQDVKSMIHALRNIGPLIASMSAETKAFNYYKSGIYVEPECPNQGNNSFDHEVTIVGYGRDADDNLDYWIIKNSWGTSWGEKGYAKIVRGVNQCGIELDVTYPIVEDLSAPKEPEEKDDDSALKKKLSGSRRVM